MTTTESREGMYIGGSRAKSTGSDHLRVISPSTEEVFATVASATLEDVDAAVSSARTAFDSGPWSQWSIEERLEVFERFRDLYAARRDDLADLITHEMGSPITLSRANQATTPLLMLESYMDIAREYPFEELRQGGGGNALVTREPVGVVAAVVPWNVPQVAAMQKVAPALLAGCTVILKPAPETPLDAFEMADMFSAAGLPDGVFNIVTADREASEHLVSHPGVDKVTFTGSTAAGRRIASICGNDLRRVTLELGGKSAAIILDDADLPAAVEALRLGSFRNTGQICSLKTRVVVPRRQVEEVVDRLVGLVESMPVGDPFDEGTQICPLAGERHRERVESLIAAGRDEGALVAYGGGRPPGLDRGWFVEPTIFTGVEPGMRIAQEEVFGPVLAVLAYDSLDDAIDIANDSAYGLSGAVFSADVSRGLQVARRIRTGTVEINGSPVGLLAPVGGFKHSGIGREAGREGFEAYLETKSLGLPPAHADALRIASEA